MSVEPSRSVRFHVETRRLEWPTVILSVEIKLTEPTFAV